MKKCLTTLLYLLLASLPFTQPAFASHIRGGTWSNVAVSPSGVVTGQITTVWNKATSSSPDNPLGIYIYAASDTARSTALASFSISAPAYTDTSDPTFALSTDSFSFNLAGVPLAPGNYVLEWSDCCRIAGIQNTGGNDSITVDAGFTYNGTSTGYAPVFNSLASGRIARGQAFNTFVNASDPSGGTITYSFITNTASPDYGATTPTGLTLNASTGQLSMSSTDTNNLVEGGIYAIKIRATSSNGSFSERDLLFTALATNNHAPVFSALSNPYSIAPGQTLTISISASDQDNGQLVTLSAQGVPSGASFTPNAAANPGTGTFTFTPTAGQAGQTFNINLTATDNDPNFPLSATANLQINVTASQQKAASAPLLDYAGLLALALGLIGFATWRRRSTER